MIQLRDAHRRWAYENLEPAAWPGTGLSPLNQAVAVFIVIAAAVAILETEKTVQAGNEFVFQAAEVVFTLVFAVEYGARLWAAGEEERFQGPLGRLKYALTPSALIDLLVLVLPLVVLLNSEAFILRLVRLMRILRLARLGRFSRAIQAIGEAVRARRYELMMSLVIAGILLLVSSTLLYLVEGDAQPEAFGSIPRAMWWSVATLTTVGYGDVFPTTTPGRFLAAITAITGIGLIAMPTGILASAFSDAIQNQRTGKTSDDSGDPE